MTLVVYISGHGFGHASRTIELMNTIGRLAPDARIVVRTAVARALFERSADVRLDVQPIDTDTGVAQIDSLHLDEDDTARRAAAFYRDFDRRVADEAAILGATGASVVVGDIPPLAFAAAARAGVTSVAVGNFTWDWIYAGYPAFARLAPDVILRIGEAYASADLALRLPMHGGFETMKTVTRDIPFIARRSVRDPAETRRTLGVAGDRPIVLTAFGGYGTTRLPIDDVTRSGRLAVIGGDTLPDGLRYPDLVAAADLVVGKPGYGIISECLANGTPLLYTSRGRFVEYDVLVAEMPRVLRCRYLPQDDLLAGRWEPAVEALLAQPAPPDRPRIDGAHVAAEAILNLVR